MKAIAVSIGHDPLGPEHRHQIQLCYGRSLHVFFQWDCLTLNLVDAFRLFDDFRCGSVFFGVLVPPKIIKQPKCIDTVQV